IPRLCLFRPPLRRRRLPPAAGNPTPPSEDTRRRKRGGTSGDSPPAAALPPGTSAQASGKRRGRALGVGLGEGGMSVDDGDGGGGGEGSEWEEGEPTDFVYTGLFPGEAKGWGGREGEEEEPVLLLFEDETVEDGQALERLVARESELMSQEDQESAAERKTRAELVTAEAALSVAEKHQQQLEAAAAAAAAATGGADGGTGDGGRVSAVMDVVNQVNRVGDLKLSLDERVETLKRVRSRLESVRREAKAERTAQSEKARFEAHRPSRWVPPAPSRFDMVASGVTIRSYRSASLVAEDLSLRAWMVVATPLRPWCGGGDAKESGMFPGVWDSLGFLPNRDPMFAKEALDVTVLIDELDASLTRSQYSTIMSIVMDNFPEPWSICPPVIEWPKRDPEVSQGVCRDPLEGRRTAQSVPVYARRLRLTVSENEEAYFFAPNEEPLDHHRRDWVSKRRAEEAASRKKLSAVPAVANGDGGEQNAFDDALPGDHYDDDNASYDLGDDVVGDEEVDVEEGSYASGASGSGGGGGIGGLEQEIQALAGNLDGFSDASSI
ncbi:unnamed protein product, partial [Ectocarpus sp. 6 AP-2014]